MKNNYKGKITKIEEYYNKFSIIIIMNFLNINLKHT